MHLILDNYSTHKTPAIHSWLAAHPRFDLHFTPTGASWLNLVERWFAELTARKLRRGVHRSVRDLNEDIRAWMDQWNQNPKPYVWTKTAEQILETLAAYCERITDSDKRPSDQTGNPRARARYRALTSARQRASARHSRGSHRALTATTPDPKPTPLRAAHKQQDKQ